MTEISVGMAVRCNSFVHLNDVYALPRQIYAGEIAKHDPWCLAATHGHHELATSGNRFSCLLRNELRSFSGNHVSIGIDFNFHHAASLASASGFFSPGLLQPPVGDTRSTSLGPQVPGAY